MAKPALFNCYLASSSVGLQTTGIVPANNKTTARYRNMAAGIRSGFI